MRTLKTITVALMMTLAACGGGTSDGGKTPSASVAIPSPVMLPEQPVVPETPEPPVVTPLAVSLTYYSLSRTEAPVNGWPTKTYTATGSCAVYLTKTYCWDDGVKNVVIPTPASTFKYTYWELQNQAASFQICHGGCTTSYMQVPKFITPSISSNVAAGSINQVFSLGIVNTASCSELSGVLTCPGFTINL